MLLFVSYAHVDSSVPHLSCRFNKNFNNSNPRTFYNLRLSASASYLNKAEEYLYDGERCGAMKGEEGEGWRGLNLLVVEDREEKEATREEMVQAVTALYT